MKGHKVLITGGAGFIGSNLAEFLSADNEVHIIDNLSTGNKANIKGLKVHFIKGSITNQKDVAAAMKGMDYVFHLGALPSVPRSIKDPVAVNEANVTGTLNVLVAARDCGIRKLVFAASSSAYGDTPTLPKVETMPPNPLSPYALTKLAGEYYCKIFNDVYGLPTTSLRYFNVYGPKQNPDSEYAAVIPKFITFIKNGQPPTIFGDGEQSRDFTFVRDAVRGTVLAATRKESDGTVINIAGGRRITVNELTRKIGALLGRDPKPEYLESRAGDVKHSLASIDRARKLLGYDPEYDIDAGLNETIKSFMIKET
ncbi:MAG: SDR family oxidoreductase [Thermoplasmata archaeon]